MYEAARPFLLALAIGLLIGIERERAHADHKIHDPLGSRTFTLLALLGALASHFSDKGVSVAVVLFAAGIIVASYFRAPVGPDYTGVGATTEVAAMATFALGYLAYSQPALAVMLSVCTLVVLALKARIHHFAEAGMSDKEISAALTFLVIAFVVLPLLPNRCIDPWNLVNPARLWLIFVLMAGISFAGYIAVKLLGPTRGLEAGGFFAGFVSSTAATLTLAQRSREPNAPVRSLAMGIVLANVASASAQVVIAGAASPDLLRAVAPVLGLPVALGALLALAGVKFVEKSREGGFTLENPLELKSTAKLAIVLGTVLVVAGVATRAFGTAGVMATALIVGTTDVHAVTLAVATMAAGGGLSVRDAVAAILIAFLANMVVKVTLAGVGGGRRLLLVVAPPLIGMMLLAVAAFFFAPLFG